MGDPRKQKKKYERPFRPWDQDRMKKESNLKEDYGLRRKKEIWKAQSELRKLRRLARNLAVSEDTEKKKEILNKVKKLGLVEKGENLDEILELKVEDVLDRRLQSLVFKKSLANTSKQARQFIVHGHVKVGDKVIKYPSFLVPKKLENEISIKEKVKDYV